MALLKIARMGHPILRDKAKPIALPIADDMARLADDMIETMLDAGGTGLAAPQVHESHRLVVYFVEATRQDDQSAESEADKGADNKAGDEQENVPLTVLVNPSWQPVSDDKVYGWEGCLSVPGLMGVVARYSQIQLSATSLDGQAINQKISGFHARVLQHEIDHLDGILYPQRMDDLSLLCFTDELRKFGPPAAALRLINAQNKVKN